MRAIKRAMRRSRYRSPVQLSVVQSEARWRFHAASLPDEWQFLLLWTTRSILDDILIARSTLTQWQVCFWFAGETTRCDSVAIPNRQEQKAERQEHDWTNTLMDDAIARVWHQYCVLEGTRWQENRRHGGKTVLYITVFFNISARVIWRIDLLCKFAKIQNVPFYDVCIVCGFFLSSYIYLVRRKKTLL